MPPLFNGPEVSSSAFDKAKLFAAETFSKNSNLHDSGISLPAFPFRTNLKLHNISASPNISELFNKCLKESCFPDYWKVSSVVPVVKNVGERSTAKNYRPVSRLSVVSKVCEKLVNNRIVDHL